jgi:hypothetical protein
MLGFAFKSHFFGFMWYVVLIFMGCHLKFYKIIISCCHSYMTSVNPVHNAPRLSVTGPGVQADRARRGGWGRERYVTDKPGPALPDFDLTWPGTPGFRLTRPGMGVGEGEVYYR